MQISLDSFVRRALALRLRIKRFLLEFDDRPDVAIISTLVTEKLVHDSYRATIALLKGIPKRIAVMLSCSNIDRVLEGD